MTRTLIATAGFMVLMSALALGHGDEMKNAREISKAMSDAKLTLKSAAAAAETAAKGKAVAAHAMMEAGKLQVVVHCLVGEKCMSVIVAADGKAGAPAEAKPESEKLLHEGGTPAEIGKLMDTAKATLAKAIDAAEAKVKGAALAVHSEVEKGALEFEVFCFAGDKLLEVDVDGAGTVTEVEEQVPHKHEDGKKDEKTAPEKKAG